MALRRIPRSAAPQKTTRCESVRVADPQDELGDLVQHLDEVLGLARPDLAGRGQPGDEHRSAEVVHRHPARRGPGSDRRSARTLVGGEPRPPRLEGRRIDHEPILP